MQSPHAMSACVLYLQFQKSNRYSGLRNLIGIEKILKNNSNCRKDKVPDKATNLANNTKLTIS